MKNFVKVVSGSLWALPFLALAQYDVKPDYFTDLVNSAKLILDRLVIFLVALAVVWFIWNVIRYSIAQDEEKKGEAKMQMVWGIVAIAVIVSIWGLVAILQNVFGVSANSGNVNAGGLLPRQ